MGEGDHGYFQFKRCINTFSSSIDTYMYRRRGVINGANVLGFINTFSSNIHAQGGGIIERLNRVMGKKIALLVFDERND